MQAHKKDEGDPNTSRAAGFVAVAFPPGSSKGKPMTSPSLQIVRGTVPSRAFTDNGGLR
jgi:hypothetical protein